MYPFQKSKAVAVISVLAIFTGACVIVGWAFNLPGLETIFPQYDSMRFNTAICFTLLGSALLITQLKTKSYHQSLFILLSVLAALLGALSLSQDIFHYNAGIDQLVITDYKAITEKYPFPGRMATNVSACFLLFGLAFIGFTVKSRYVHTLSQYFLHVVSGIAAVAIMGYLYGLSLFYKLTFVGSMAVHTAILLFSTSVIASLLHPSLGIAKLFTGQLVGNRMARRLFILIVLMVIIFRSIRLQSQRYGISSAETGASLISVCFMFASLLLIWYTANWLNRIDLKRYQAEEEVKGMNEVLEERVEKRSAELFDLLEKYKESESKFRTAFELSAIGMALVSLDGKWLKVNKRLCEMVGYPEQELLSMTFMDITYPDDLEDNINTMKKAATGESGVYHVEKRYIHKNGSIVWANVNMTTVKDDQNKPLYLVSQIEDITETKKINARFKSIVESDFVAIKLNDIDGNIIYRSPSMQSINGWTDEEMNRSYFKLAHPDDLEMIKKAHREVSANPGKSVNIIYRILHKNGGYIWIESQLCNELSNPDLGAIITVTRDVTERKTIEDQLRKSEENYRSLIEHASDAIYLVDYEGNLTDANESMCKMTGYSRDELLHMNIEQLIDPEQLKTDPVQHGRRSPGQSVMRERRLVHKNGQLFEVEVNVKTFTDDRTLVIARDITDRKRMEAELREAELKFRTLAEKSMVGVYISQHERFTYINPRFAEIFGYEPNELINTPGSTIDLIINEEDQAKVRASIEARNRGEIESANYEVRGKRKDGTSNHVEFYGSRVMVNGQPAIIGTLLDITERKRAEAILIRSEANLKTIMDTTDSAYVLLDKKLRTIAYNHMAVKLGLSQYNHVPTKGEKLTDFLPKERLEQFIKNADEVLTGKNISYELNYPQADGSVLWYFVRLFPITNDKKEIFGLMIALSNITERKNAEENLRAAYNLIQDHISSIKEMAWKQSHLIRSPIANLKGLAALLKDNPSDDELLKFINIELERLDTVITDMAEDASNHAL